MRGVAWPTGWPAAAHEDTGHKQCTTFSWTASGQSFGFPPAPALLRPVKENAGPRAPGVKSVQIVRQISSCTDPGSQVALFFAIVPMYSVSASSFAAKASNCARLS